MSIETKIVADFYARLFPWIDHGRGVSLCRDDGGVGASAIADLCFHFLGAADPFRVEFKTLNKGDVIGCTKKQVATWKTPTNASPHVWIAIDNGASFLFWRHDDPAFLVNFRTGKPTSNGNYFHVTVPKRTRLTLPAAFVEILKYAQSAGMLR